MDGSHPDDDPVPHRHRIELAWWRTELDASMALGDGWGMELYIPFDVKDQKVRFALPNGSSFDNPAGEIHHRTERLEGLGDIELSGLLEVAEWRFALGIGLPTGGIEEDPYELGALGRIHQHIQFGTGTFDPIARISWSGEIGATLGIRAPLYENRKGYKGSTVIDFAAGPTLEITEGMSVSLRYTAMYQTRAEWKGEADRNSGYFLQGISASFPIDLGDGMVLRPSVLWSLDVDVRAGADNFEMEWLFGISLDLSFPAPSV